jgi:hypothetical protein
MAVEPAPEPEEEEPSLDDEPEATFHVALGSPGDAHHNTLVLGGTDVWIPLEMDADNDPFQDDALCLRSVSGLYEQALTSRDPEVLVDAEKHYLHYRFEDVPSGVYQVDLQVAGRWVSVLSGIVVSRGEARVRDELLSEEPPAEGAAPDDIEEEPGDDEPGEPSCAH